MSIKSSNTANRRHWIVALLAATALTACEPANTNTAENTEATAVSADMIAAETERLNEWFETKFEEEVAFSPIQQSFLGRKTNNDVFDDLTREAELEQLAWKRASVEEMKAKFDYDKLDPVAKTSWDLWINQLERQKAADAFTTNAYVFNQMTQTHALFPRVLIAVQRVDDANDMNAYISRIRATKTALEQLVERSKENAATGVRPPLFSFELVIDSARKIITGEPFTEGDDSSIWADAKGKINTLLEQEKIDSEQAEALMASAQAALVEDWQPAYEALIAWQQEDMANAEEVAAGVSTLPNGIDFYNERLANQTTTSLTADEIHEIGLSEVARLRAEMEAVKEQVGFGGDLGAFFVELRDNKDDPRYYYPDTDEGRQAYIDDATAAIDGIKAKLPDYFGILPKADLVVKRVEAFREQPGAAQHYSPSTPDGSRPGVYYAHLSDMKAMPKRELEVIAYHEGLPGHHMQIAIQQELTGVPTFRTQAGFTAYSEGWGLYSELLAKEMDGTYTNPYSEFGRLGSEIWRAIRLVLDTGLHAKGWTEDQAVEYFKANSAITEAQARSEVRRYMVLPGQATSYKIGMLKIIELRKKAEAALGDKFDIRGFHDTVLGGGAVPLSILERLVEQWIAKVQAA